MWHVLHSDGCLPCHSRTISEHLVWWQGTGTLHAWTREGREAAATWHAWCVQRHAGTAIYHHLAISLACSLYHVILEEWMPLFVTELNPG